jgi:hypothetical protein
MLKIEQAIYRWAPSLWALVLITLPVTSFRYFPFFGNETRVRPLSLYPLVPLFIILIIQRLRMKRPLFNANLTPLFIFVLLILATSALAGLYAPLDLRNNSYWGRMIRAWLTLSIGIVFLLTAIWKNENEEDLRFTLKWLYAGLAIDLGWALLQTASLYINIPNKTMMDSWQELFSLRGLVKNERISGLAFEPSWLAGQLITLYFPWLFASILKGYHATRFRWLEIFLFSIGMILNLLSYSRTGILLAFVVILATLILTGRAEIASVLRWFWNGGNLSASQTRRWFVRIGSGIIALSILGGTVFTLSQGNYFAKLWTSRKDNLTDYFIDVYAGSRIAYAISGWNIYTDHPLTGSGLGASGLYMYDKLPDWSLGGLPEITRNTSPLSNIYPNPKNMYSRILAEAGIFSFAAFLLYYFGVLGRIIQFLKTRRSFQVFVGTAGIFAWLAIMLHNLTQDSFAIPNAWVSAGILLGLINTLKE